MATSAITRKTRPAPTRTTSARCRRKSAEKRRARSSKTEATERGACVSSASLIRETLASRPAGPRPAEPVVDDRRPQNGCRTGERNRRHVITEVVDGEDGRKEKDAEGRAGEEQCFRPHGRSLRARPARDPADQANDEAGTEKRSVEPD